MIFPNPIRVSGTQAFWGCRFCHGNGCLACQAEADRAYKAEFPDGPKPIATIAHDGTPEGLARILSTLLGGITQESQQRAQDTLAANPAIESLTAQCGLTAEQTKQGLAAALTPTILEERAVRMSQPTLL